jgi:hypothetical protein
MQVRIWLVRYFCLNSFALFCCVYHCVILLFPLSLIGAFLDTAAEEQRVNLRVDSLLRLARANDIDFWADETRCRRIVQFQDRAT